MKRFALVTQWHLDAPIELVWQALHAVDDWPRWRRYWRRHSDGIGQVMAEGGRDLARHLGVRLMASS